MKDKAQRTSAFSIIFSRLKKEKKRNEELNGGKNRYFFAKVQSLVIFLPCLMLLSILRQKTEIC